MLQGTFATLSLVEVLELLAGSRKTGALHLVAGREEGTVWVDDGMCIGVDHAGARPAADGLAPGPALVARLVRLGGVIARHGEGAFRFLPGESPTRRAEVPVPLRDGLAEIDRQLMQWRAVQRHVPSLDARPQRRADLQVDELVLDRSRWRLVHAVDGLRTVRELADHVGVDELAVCQALAGLVEAGAVDVAAPDVPAEHLGHGVLAELPYGPGVDTPHRGPVPAGTA